MRGTDLLALVLLGLAAGCGPGETQPRVDPAEPPGAPIASPADTAPLSPADTGGPSPENDPAWTAGISRVERPDVRMTTLSEVRIGEAAGYERFVVELAGDTLPGHHIEYVDSPVRQCGSGEPVPIEGDGWLQIRLEPARAHTEAGQPTIEDRRRAVGQPVIREAVLTCDFEGQVEWVLGVSTPNRYRVLELSDPARLVIDLRSR